MENPPIDPNVLAALKALNGGGGRKPIVVSNPNDPRLKAYRDSLALHNNSVLSNNLFKKGLTKNQGLDLADKQYEEDSKPNSPYNRLTRLNKKEPTTTRQGKPLLYTDTKEIGSFNEVYKKPEQPVILQRNNGNLRPDGTPKGKGFFGEIKRPDGKVSTELSISSGDIIPGKEVLIPTMVPTLTNAEVSYLLSGKYNPKARQGMDDVISRKAIDFARKRAANKQPFFATPQEEGRAVPFVPPPPDLLQPRQAPMNIAPSWAAPAPNVASAPMAQPAQGMNPIWGPGPRYSIKDEGVKQMLRAIQNIKRK